MKILHVIDQLNVGGAERVLVDLASLQYDQGFDVSVITLVTPGPLANKLPKQVPFICMNRGWRYDPTALWRINRFAMQFEVVHVHLRYNFRYIALGKLLFGGGHLILLHDHFGDIENDLSVPLGLSFMLRFNPWYAGVSRTLIDWATKRVGLPAENCFLLPNIILKRQVQVHSRASSPIRHILLVSNFREAKNHEFAIRLLNELKYSLDFKATFVGQVIDKSFYHDLQQRVSDFGLNSHITFLTDCDDAQLIMKDFDLAVHTAYQESGPLVLIEYLAQQLPFVAYKTGEVASQIGSRCPDLFLNSFVIEDWISRILEVEKKREALIPKMESIFEEHYSSGAYFKRISTVYNRMLSQE